MICQQLGSFIPSLSGEGSHTCSPHSESTSSELDNWSSTFKSSIMKWRTTHPSNWWGPGIGIKALKCSAPSFHEVMRKWKDGVYSQCGCIAHAELALEKPNAYKHHLRQLIQMQTPLHNKTGILFSVTLLELLMGALGKSNFVAQRSDLVDSVSYMLLASHMFRGYPDFAIHYESTTMASRLFVLMGEVQLTQPPRMPSMG